MDWIEFDNDEEKKVQKGTKLCALLEYFLAVWIGASSSYPFWMIVWRSIEHGGNAVNIDQNKHFGLETKNNAGSLQTVD